MTLQEALSFTGNEYQAMTYDELVEVTRAMYEAARKRISRQPEGPAYRKLFGKAVGKGLTKKLGALSVKNGKISISQKFKGPNKMSMADLRSLRKALTDFLRDPTSTIRGYERYEKETNEEFKAKMVTDVPELDPNAKFSIVDIFNSCETDSELLRFASNHLDWDSDQKYVVIMLSGGYEMLGTESFTKKLRKYVKADLKNKMKEIKKKDPKFFYTKKDDSKNKTTENETTKSKPKFFF